MSCSFHYVIHKNYGREDIMPFMEILFSAISALTPSFPPDKYAANARYYIFLRTH